MPSPAGQRQNFPGHGGSTLAERAVASPMMSPPITAPRRGEGRKSTLSPVVTGRYQATKLQTFPKTSIGASAP